VFLAHIDAQKRCWLLRSALGRPRKVPALDRPRKGPVHPQLTQANIGSAVLIRVTIPSASRQQIPLPPFWPLLASNKREDQQTLQQLPIYNRVYQLVFERPDSFLTETLPNPLGRSLGRPNAKAVDSTTCKKAVFGSPLIDRPFSASHSIHSYSPLSSPLSRPSENRHNHTTTAE